MSIGISIFQGCGSGGGGGNGDSNGHMTNGENPPVASNLCVATPVNTTKNGSLPATDLDNQTLYFEILSQPTKGSLSTDAAGNYSYTPRPNVRGLDRFTFRARDSTGRTSNVATVNLFVDGALRIMPLGDSITEGISNGSADLPAPGQRVGYRRKLYSSLSGLSSAYGVNFVGSLSDGLSASPAIGDPQHEGHGGYCASATPYCSNGNIASNVVNWLSANSPDIVLLHIGTNDFTTDPSGVQEILDNINSWESANYPIWVFVARIIQTADGHLDVNTFNDNVAAMIAARNSDRIFMVNQQTGAGMDYRVGADMGDTLHPSQSGYDKMADKWTADLLNSGVLPSCP